MPEYTYLLETRLSSAQQNALAQVRDAARAAGMTVFLAGGAVRDLTTGSSVRDLDFTVQGNALDLAPALAERGGVSWGSHEPSRTLFFFFPGSVRVEVASARSESFPKPGEPQYSWNGIVDDLHRRDFTANAMALSLNEGSYGLLLDPLNGVADIEARQLRLVSNYGFIEDPSRLVRAVRLSHRLGWSLEERTATRYENAKEADNFDVVSAFLRGYELEEIAAEENALSTLKQLEAEGWMAKLFAAWTADTADVPALEDLHRNRIQLLMQGVSADLTAAHLEVLTAGLKDGERDALKAAMVRPGLRAQWEGLDGAAKEFARLLTSKDAAMPSATWRLFHSHAAEPILWLAHTRKGGAVEAKFKNFFTVWPEAAKKVPVAMMLEMRITPELPVYTELLQELFLQQIDGKVETDEQMRAFLEAYSPPAPPPPVTLRRTRGKKAEGKGKRKGASREDDDEEDEDDQPSARGSDDDAEDLDDSPDPDAAAEDDEEGDEEDDVQPIAVSTLGGGRKLNLDKIDLGAVLGRIATDDLDDEGDLDDDFSLPGAPPRDEEESADSSVERMDPGADTVLGTSDETDAPAAKAPANEAESKPAAAAGKREPSRTGRKDAGVKSVQPNAEPAAPAQAASFDVIRGAAPAELAAPAKAGKGRDADAAQPGAAKPAKTALKEAAPAKPLPSAAKPAKAEAAAPLKKSAAPPAVAAPAKAASPPIKRTEPAAKAPAKKVAAPPPASGKKQAAQPAVAAKKQAAPAKAVPAKAPKKR